MTFYVVNHEVEDFDKWKKVYDGFEDTRKRFGVKEHYALQSNADANHVMVVGEGSPEAVNSFLNSEDLKSGMESAGISGPPMVFVGENKK